MRLTLGLLLALSALGYQLLTGALFDLPGVVLWPATGVVLGLLWPLLQRLGKFLWWVLIGVMMIGIVGAEPAARGGLALGALLVLVVIWLVRRFLTTVVGAFTEGYRGRSVNTTANGQNTQPSLFEVLQGREGAEAWDRVIIPAKVKRDLLVVQSVLQDCAGLQREWGQSPPLGLLLYGPPGTGKTLIARTLAVTSGYAFIAVSASDILDAAVGSSEKKVHALYEQARRAAPCIVFIDEIDTLASRRSATGMDWGGAVRGYNNTASQLLQEIDGFKESSRPVFTVGATNRLDVLDEALRSRLSYHVYISAPDEMARQRLFELYTRPYRHKLGCSSAWLASVSSGLTGRDIREVCRWVATYGHGVGAQKVDRSVFERAFERLRESRF